MIIHLVNLLRQLFTEFIEQAGEDVQIGFQPPDDVWRTSLQAEALNVYLFDIRENSELRSNERVRKYENGMVSETPAPRRIDCHYLITAWSSADPQHDPTVDEHELLYAATQALMNNQPFNLQQLVNQIQDTVVKNQITAFYGDDLKAIDLPTQVLPAEGFPKYGEFWGAMGEGSRWKPGIYLIVTLPVLPKPIQVGHIVTTINMETKHIGELAGDEMFQIGGLVLDATGEEQMPIPKAWVRLETLDGASIQTTNTDEDGRFTFIRLPRGRYQLHLRAAGFTEPEVRQIDVPSPDGKYDLRFE